MICEICKKDFKNLGRHLSNNGKLIHSISGKDYYLKYILKSEKEPVCTCGNKVSFYGISVGFSKHCSINCYSMSKCKNKSRKKPYEIKINNLEYLRSWIIDNLCYTNHNLIACKVQKRYLKKNYLNVIDEIEKYTYFLERNVSLSERIYCIINNIKKQVICIACGKNMNFISYNKGYNVFCCTKCSTNHYSVKEKTKKTCIKKYGGPSPNCSSAIREKTKKTCIKKYGGPSPNCSSAIREKTKKTCIKKYGRKYYCRYPISEEILSKISNPQWLEAEHFVKQKSVLQISKELGISQRRLLNEFCKFGIKVSLFSKSIAEKEIIDFIGIGNIESNTRNIISPYELDIYIPGYNLAIEFNGLYWHSRHDKNYHLNKTKMCENKDVHLLHIFENEWIDPIKQDIWKSIINNKLGKNNKIFARKTEVREITDNKIVKEFLDNNHLQGHCASSVKLGLFHENELVSIMTFGKTRFSRKYEWEMIRFCNKKFNNVIGGASKLYKYFINNYKPNSAISYADRRYSNGNLYKKLGFKFSHNSNPNYWYFESNSYTLHSRIKFQKHKLSSLLGVFDNDKSEVENMANNNYLRIFDCGNIIYTWSN